MVYMAAATAAIVIAFVSIRGSPGVGATLVTARQLYGLWSLGLLLASLALGPLTSIIPWIPFKSELMYGRRAVGVSATSFAVTHLGCYVWSILLRNWRELYTTGPVWVAGLVVGIVAMADMAVLSLTSRDASVKRMGGRKWKRLHRTGYAILLRALIHALFVGADFGWHRAPDVIGEGDAGAGITFLCLSLVWLATFVARHQGVRWVRAAE